ncbi:MULTISPECIES: type II toxin-antitoxin system HipA family toxin [Gammaproteobacteria]|uniref:type II toxin-antitoxin system HipA family toxin n=1 Tax=Gammaproteobacteria TaxID=1236 RepID=UPI000DD07086|nr:MULTISPECIES: type II toxin-antitoxin system HipA family toxin [Gammaproteobacteria]RTE86575.1 type II toxin-antitoxin system HipA family toxin [Aliidiomarina sp. B3213]TCZ90870.1 type II toxin-antitoxin system HipA family toxin [Lysobacter sp. N42]
MSKLDVYMNGFKVGYLKRSDSGAHEFRYDNQWLIQEGARPISLSMPLRHDAYYGPEVINFFDNLLPDNEEIRDRVVARYAADSNQAFDLLSAIGRDSVGALQFVPEGKEPSGVRELRYEKLTEEKLERILTGYQSRAPLGMLRELDDFKISIAGAQEKTALLKVDGEWCIPVGNTPTSHILKLPIGKIESHDHTIDLSDSVENEMLCLRIAKAFGFDVPDCEVVTTSNVKALAIERFDRKYAKDRSWLMRLPQEDYCQVFGLPSARKYESDNGPSIADIMKHLQGSAKAQHDREVFMAAQVLFFLLAATDGHAKNFSLHIEPYGAYRLTPLYDIISAYPMLGGTGLNIRQLKLAMSLRGSTGKKWNIYQIFKRHFLNTSKLAEFSPTKMNQIISNMCGQVDDVISRVQKNLPRGFPEVVSKPIFEGMQARKERLMRTQQEDS